MQIRFLQQSLNSKYAKIHSKILAKSRQNITQNPVAKNGCKIVCRNVRKSSQKNSDRINLKTNNFLLILNVNSFFITSDSAQENKLIRTATKFKYIFNKFKNKMRTFYSITKELSLCNKLWFSNPYIFSIQCLSLIHI